MQSLCLKSETLLVLSVRHIPVVRQEVIGVVVREKVVVIHSIFVVVDGLLIVRVAVVVVVDGFREL